ncbi:MAG: hypothetical protein ACEPO8_00190 [Rhodothermaceae bacterium]
MNISDSINSDLCDTLCKVHETLTTQNVNYFLIGATARDIILNDLHRLEINRRITADIDFGVCISDWRRFAEIKTSLIAIGAQEDSNQTQRLILENFPLDFVPFGEVADDDEISWPPSYDRIMSIQGYQEAFDNALELQIKNDPEVKIKVVDLIHFVTLKLIAWEECYPTRRKDAIDIQIIIENYLGAGNEHKITDDLTEDPNYDYELAGAQILGWDMKVHLTEELMETCRNILQAEAATENNYRLAQDFDPLPNQDADRMQELIKSLYLGLTETTQ